MILRLFNSIEPQSDLEELLQGTRSREEQVRRYTDDQLADRAKELRLAAAAEGDSLPPVVDRKMEAAAIGCEAIRRTLGFTLHDVQVKGALSAADGAIIEMQTGEGKTVVCGLAAFIRSVFDLSVHVATTNEYLAERDHESVADFFAITKTSSAVLQHDYKTADTRAAYRKRITYGPGYLFGFDYLRDQMTLRDEEELSLGRDVLDAIHGRDLSEQLLQPRHQSIIVDEADSVLIDEAATPLILSGGHEQQSGDAKRPYLLANSIVTSLVEDDHYILERTEKRLELTVDGRTLGHNCLLQHGRLSLSRPWTVYLENALYAAHLLLRDEHYVVEDNAIKLVDQNTGRIFEDRTLRNGLHQALEAKEHLPVKPPSRTMARVTRQRYFQLYEMVCGMTGTAVGSEQELEHFYGTTVVPLSPHRPSKRVEFPTRFFNSWESKLAAAVRDVASRQASGQPILVGTRTIRESLEVEEALRAAGIECVVLNGVQDALEADIVSGAGAYGAITIATNMAGRGTDIKLSQESREAGGLHVLCLQRHVSRRIDRQLSGRSARQGAPGSSQFFVAADDELLANHNESLAQRIRDSADDQGECHLDLEAGIKSLQESLGEEAFEKRRVLVQQDAYMDSIRESLVAE